jgi:uncharacterized protein YndB with AHSA1/START domain
MATLITSTTVNKRVETVFNYVVDVANHKSWQAGISDAQVTPEGPVGVGSTYLYTTEVMGQKYKSQMQVSAFEPNKTWAVKTVGVPTSVETVYAFAPAGDATQLTISMDVPAGAYPAAAEGAIKQQMQKSLEEQAARIKLAVGD